MSPAPAKTPPGGRSLAGEVRIIGGQWKRSRLPVADRPGLRPTPDRVRETLFNWLGQDLTGWRCVDPFAGSGALGFEAASRGAAEVRMWEQDAALVAKLSAVRERLGASVVRIERADGLNALRRLAPASVDLVFVDPPFDSGLHAAALAASRLAMNRNGRIYLEAPVAWQAGQLAPMGLALHKHLRAGNVHAHLLVAADGAEAAAA
ncbi:MAG: 16S rRNA (guanine(966)-N(2))-methyltransferase RsmD [Burkholderiales bacterium]